MDTIICHLCHKPHPATEFNQRHHVLLCRSCRALLAAEPIPEGHKRCSQCLAIKPFASFYHMRRAAHLDQHKPHCDTCQSTLHATIKAKRKDAEIESNPSLMTICFICQQRHLPSAFNALHMIKVCRGCRKILQSEQVPEDSRRCIRCFKIKPLGDFYIQHRKNNPEYRVTACNTCFSASQSTRINRRLAVEPELRKHGQEVAKTWRDAHPAQVAASAKKSAKAHPEKRRESVNRYRTKKAGAPLVDLSLEQWLEICQAFQFRCAYCPPNCIQCRKKTHALEQEHITPVANNGSYTLHNIIPACRKCNATKHTKLARVPVQPLLITLALAKKPKDS